VFQVGEENLYLRSELHRDVVFAGSGDIAGYRRASFCASGVILRALALGQDLDFDRQRRQMKGMFHVV